MQKKKIKDTKGVIRSRKLKKNRQHNGKKRIKEQINDQQSTRQKTKDRVTRIPLKTGSELRCPRRVSSSFSTCGTRCDTLITNHVIGQE